MPASLAPPIRETTLAAGPIRMQINHQQISKRLQRGHEKNEAIREEQRQEHASATLDNQRRLDYE